MTLSLFSKYRPTQITNHCQEISNLNNLYRKTRITQTRTYINNILIQDSMYKILVRIVKGLEMCTDNTHYESSI